MALFSISSVIFFNLVWVSLAEMAMQIVISDLSDKARELTALQQPYKFDSLCRLKFWHKLSGKWFWVLSPLLVLITILFNIHRFISELFACPYCVGFHLGWLTNWLFLGMPIFQALLFAPMVLVWVAVLDRIHTHG